METLPLRVRIARKQSIAQDTWLFELRRENGELPAFDAGSHIAVQTPAGQVRRYSLSNAPFERSHYAIAVKREPRGQGGSLSLTDQTREGDWLSISAPQNYFPLATAARRSLLIAGGIGITPLLSMARHLQAAGHPFRLVYLTRAPGQTAFLDDCTRSPMAAHTVLHHTYGDPRRAFDLAALLAERGQDEHLYCCGSRRLMQAVRTAASHWPAGTLHFEDFGSAQPTHESDRPYTVRLARSGLTVEVRPGITMLAALREAGIDAPSSCESGTCGACRTRVLAGQAEHRDFILDEDEQERDVIICVSRAQGPELVLDL
ncbi:phthalate 4,5-dioxygenase [Pigmentiphaga sp. NML080357]|uniref:PDR/VanB family oxidoreductase n=1 Tax=Pigmentiphaga sp. NML080357 TaxID=2008675 RepID=UPI000B41621E|nr:PDR/VanB family oxidoreductase [Pigmentiphaga sp. NML080357]OVZ61257.1 phthalate 4,5-dioxygenase [Pigmentiphaga sp. NML080357]